MATPTERRRKRGDLYRMTKSHGGEIHLEDVNIPMVSDAKHRARTIIVRDGSGSATALILHNRAIRKLARDFAAMARRLPRRE